MRAQFGLEVGPQLGLESPVVTQESLELLQGLCSAHDDFGVVALEAAANTAKSVCVALCLFDGFLSVAQAAHYAREEEILQIAVNGRVEGTHDIDELYTTTSLSACKSLISLKSW